VYAAFGSHQDAPPWQGFVIAFDAETLRQIEPAFCTTPGGGMGGIWQAGNGPAADGEGNLYVMTGNGSFDPDGKQFGSTFLKLSPDLTVLDWFAPATVGDLNLLDVDLGSSGPMLMPDTDEIVGGGKDGKLFVLQRSKLGGLQQHHWPHDRLNPPVQFFQAARPWRITPFSWFPFLSSPGTITITFAGLEQPVERPTIPRLARRGRPRLSLRRAHQVQDESPQRHDGQ
jgi:hypothetical protein